MCNGWRVSLEKSQHGQARAPSALLGALVTCILALLAGCGHATSHQRPDLTGERAAVTAEELFVVALSHARSGDLLRAEQYLSAARQHGYDEATLIYWLVRVCIASSRYQSALRHAAEYLRQNPSDWPLRLVVASIHEALGDQSRAQSELELVVKAEPSEPLPHYRLAMLYRTVESQQERASAHLQAYLRLDPQGAHSAEVRAALQEVTDVADAAVGPQRVLNPWPHDRAVP